MAKKVAALTINPVNGLNLFQYLESFFENGITYKVYAVAGSRGIKMNSDIALTVDDVIANLEGHEDGYDAIVFACGDVVPVFQQNTNKQHSIDLMDVVKNFGEKGKIIIGRCAAAMLFDFTGITEGKTLAVHPLTKSAISKGQTTDKDSVIDGNFFTAKEEHYICTMMPQVLRALKK